MGLDFFLHLLHGDVSTFFELFDMSKSVQHCGLKLIFFGFIVFFQLLIVNDQIFVATGEFPEEKNWIFKESLFILSWELIFSFLNKSIEERTKVSLLSFEFLFEGEALIIGFQWFYTIVAGSGLLFLQNSF